MIHLILTMKTHLILFTKQLINSWIISKWMNEIKFTMKHIASYLKKKYLTLCQKELMNGNYKDGIIGIPEILHLGFKY